MNRMSKLSAVLVVLLFSAGAMAQSVTESSDGATSLSNPVTAANPAQAAQKDTANSKMTKTTSTKTTKKPKMAKKTKSSSDSSSQPMSNTTSN